MSEDENNDIGISKLKYHASVGNYSKQRDFDPLCFCIICQHIFVCNAQAGRFYDPINSQLEIMNLNSIEKNLFLEFQKCTNLKLLTFRSTIKFNIACRLLRTANIKQQELSRFEPKSTYTYR